MEKIYRIGIDHGYGNIKTAHHIFESGIIQRERASELAGMTVEFEGKFYEIGSTEYSCGSKSQIRKLGNQSSGTRKSPFLCLTTYTFLWGYWSRPCRICGA